MERLKFVLYRNQDGNERVLFPDYDIDFHVDENDEGKKYFPVINLYTIQKNNKLSSVFTDRVADIIKTIRDGNADCMVKRNILFGDSFTAVRFIDREYGEKIRQISLEGFKDSEFIYKIRLKSTMFGKLYLGDNNRIVNNILDAKIFKSEEDATTYIENINKELFCEYEDFDEDEIHFKICQDLLRKGGN